MHADVREPDTLPRPLSSFIGRQDVLAEVAALLEANRLVTLTGPGGSGKTRLSFELAIRARSGYPDGAYFVPLAAIRDPALVPSSIARCLGLHDARDRPLVDHLASYLCDRSVLLVLDNFEHLLASASQVAELLAAAPHTRMVVTSRSPLRLSGEQQFLVPPLPVPEPGAKPATLYGSESAELFLARARAVAPSFAADEGNAAAIAGIVRRLDGLPLAIELAAARVRLLPPAEILARLDHSLGLLVGGGRDLPDRQQTLRSTIAWSYDLLGDAARGLMAALSVFRGGAALPDLEVVCADLGVPVLEALQELLDQSLLRLSAGAGRPRYAMLETVREFAAERLAERPDADRAQAAHAAVFVALARQLERPPIWPGNDFLAVLDQEHDNLRAAVEWLQERDPPTALQMTARMTAFWSIRGHFAEGRQRLHDMLERVREDTGDRVAALNGAGWLALDQGELDTSIRLLDEAVGLAHAISDRVGEGTALLNRGRTALGGRDGRAGRDLQQALEILQSVGDDNGVAAAMMFHGLPAMITGEFDVARARLAACVTRCEQLELSPLRARALQLLGIAHLLAGDVAGGASALADGVPMVVASGDRYGIAVGIGALAMLAAAQRRPRLALRMEGVLDAYAEVNQVVPPQPLGDFRDRLLAPIRAAAGASAQVLRAEGRRLPLSHALAETFSGEPEQPWRTGPGPGLTRREVEVAQLVATGATNREVAARLHLSTRTVDVHVDRILTKLGFHTRTQLAAWAHKQGLLPKDTQPRT